MTLKFELRPDYKLDQLGALDFVGRADPPRIDLGYGHKTPLITRKMDNPLAPKPEVETVLVRAQNVHDYFMKHYEEHDWMALTPFTCVRPPYRQMVFTYDHKFIRRDGPTDIKSLKELTELEKSGAVGLETVRHVDVRIVAASEELLRHVKVGKATFSDIMDKVEEEIPKTQEYLFSTILDEVKPAGIISIELAFEGSLLPGHMFVMYDESGQVLTWNNIAHFFIRTPKERKILDETGVEHNVWEMAFKRHTAIAMAAIQFMNCRNVEIIDNVPTRQQRRHAEREGTRPPVTYKTLIIHPIGKRRARGVSVPTGEEMPLHICRGHFKDYRAGSGLGRWHRHGLWWWAPSVRGTLRAGKVVKDYDIKLEEKS